MVPMGLMMTTLTKKIIATLTLPEGAKEKFFWDEVDKGFALRIRIDNDGKENRSFWLQYRYEGIQRRPKLMTNDVDRARKIARDMLEQVKRGDDPLAAKQAKQKAERLIFAAVAKQFIDYKSGPVRSSTHGAIVGYLTGPYFRSLHRMPLNKISMSDVSTCLNAIHKNSATAAQQARTNLSAFFAWAMKQGHCAANPVIGTDTFKTNAGGRERTLKDTELAAVWKALGDDSDYARIMKLLILTACRRNEVGQMRWQEIADDTWTIPAERSKNKRPHKLPITSLAAEIIATVPRKRDDFVFGLTGEGFCAWSASKKLLDAKLNFGEEWTVHDIRRSVATWMGENGIEPHIIEAVLNHNEAHSGVKGVYNRAKYERQIRNALAMWNEHLHALISGTEPVLVQLRSA
jgi:integrase